MALFITFEGGEGSGKSTQAQILFQRLRKQKKWGVSYAEEPGTTLLGRQVREWLREPKRPLIIIPGGGTQLTLLDTVNNHSLPAIHLHANSPRTELLAFTLARSQLVEEFIIPKLKGKSIVVCNRYADSTTAYQGYGRGLDLKLVEMANNIATQGLKPDLTILLDIPPEKGLIRKFGDIRDQFEKEVLEFHHRVRDGYLKLASSEPRRWLVIDATQSKEEIADIIWKRVSQLLKSQKG
ncbi:MAG: dTMP kinase [Chloroflexi bacterium]|nr:dTMP kinase [Chloroflexota bacterium]